MTKPANPQSLKRYSDSLAPLFDPSGSRKPDVVFIKSSTDIGVERNGGRNGPRLGPRSFMSCFKKLNQDSRWQAKRLLEVEVGNEQLELEDFARAQEAESEKIYQIMIDHPLASICHVGGGHDHAYPFMLALKKKYSRIIVINIDAHADTRDDQSASSGTPFRHFDEAGGVEYFIYQIGLHHYANSFSTLKPLANGKMEIIWKKDFKNPAHLREIFERISSLCTKQTAVLFSLDADAIDGSLVPGVSAVNGDGLELKDLQEVWDNYRSLPLQNPPYLGIYELNPVYDTISMKSTRTLAGFVFEVLG